MLTYFDLVEHLITSSFGGPQDAEQRDIRTAVQRAYDEVTKIRDWTWYSQHGRVNTESTYGTGTVSYDTSTRNLTLTGGTWPSWAAAGHVKIGVRIAKVASRTSNTVLVLDPQVTFPETLTAVNYVLFRSLYPLPDDFRNMDEPSDELNWWSGLYLSPDQAMKIERISNSTGAPFHWTFVRDEQSGGWAIRLVGYPTGVETIDFTYRRTARRLKYSGHEGVVRAGTIAASGTSVTGTNTTFPVDAAGSFLRVGDATDHPQTLAGLKPYAAEVEVTARASGTAITVAESVTASGDKYILTDPVDIAPHMHNCMYSACEYWLARIRNQAADKAFSLYQRDLRLAMEQEALAPLSGRLARVYYDGGWRSALLPDVG
jgi:hypothetical protein